MIRDVTDSEYLLAHKTAEEYRSQGYEVMPETSFGFLSDFRPSLLVRKGNEVKVIAVKERHSLAADPKLAEMARLIESKPGWSFELLLVAEPESVTSPGGASSFDSEHIVRRLEQAEKAFRLELPEAAFMLAWSAFEAAIRALIAVSEEAFNRRITSPRFVLDQAAFHGLISRDDYKALTRMLRYRNAIVHGFATDDFGDELVKELIETVRRITTETGEL